MKLCQIDVQHFGQLDNVHFDLNATDLNVFFGANEAGKSTTVAFIKQVLFGFHLKSKSSPFFEDYTPLRPVSPMGGSLIFEDGSDHFKLTRLFAKGDKTKSGLLTVVQNGQKVDQEVFFSRIHKIDGDFYAESFVFNQELLTSIKQLTKNQLLEQIYHLGAAQSKQFLEWRDEFQNNAAGLFKPRGKKPVVNQLLEKEKNQQLEMNQEKDQFRQYQQLETQKVQVQKQLDHWQSDQQTATDQLNHVVRLLGESQSFSRYQSLKAQREPIDFDDDAFQKARLQEKRIEDSQERLTTKENNLKLQQKAQEETGTKAAFQSLLPKKTLVLKWQLEFHQLGNQQSQLKGEIDSLTQTFPEIIPLAQLDPETRQHMKQVWQDRPQEASAEKNDVKAVHSNLGLLTGIIGLIGLILGLVHQSWGWFVLAMGVLGFLAVEWQENQKRKTSQQEAAKKKAQEAAETSNFQQTYHVSPNQLTQESFSALQAYLLKVHENQQLAEKKTQILTQMMRLSNELHAVMGTSQNSDFDAVLDRFDDLAKKQDEIKLNAQFLSDQETQLTQEKIALAQEKLKFQEALNQAHVTDMVAYQKLHDQVVFQQKLQEQMRAIQDSLGDDFELWQKHTISDDQALLTQRQELQNRLENDRKEISQCQNRIAELVVEQRRLADSDRLFIDRQELANTQTELLNAVSDYLSDAMTSQWLTRGLDLASNDRFPKMAKQANRFLTLLTAHRYLNIQFDKKIGVERSDGSFIPVEYLSRGTAEQLYFALKFAFIQQISDQIDLPVLIDDAFVDFDDERVVNIRQLMQEIIKTNQVLIFTARQQLVKTLGQNPILFVTKEK